VKIGISSRIVLDAIPLAGGRRIGRGRKRQRQPAGSRWILHARDAGRDYGHVRRRLRVSAPGMPRARPPPSRPTAPTRSLTLNTPNLEYIADFTRAAITTISSNISCLTAMVERTDRLPPHRLRLGSRLDHTLQDPGTIQPAAQPGCPSRYLFQNGVNGAPPRRP